MAKVLTDKRENGKWRYRFAVASIDGKRKYKSESGFETEKEAYAAGVKAKSQYDATGVTFEPRAMSFADYLDYWIDNYVKTNCTDTTREGYEKKIRLYIKPALGEYYLHKLTPAALQKFMDKMAADKFSRNTLISVKGILSGCLSYAVEPLRFIESSPALYVKIPARRALKSNTKKERRPVTDDEWILIMKRFPAGHPSHLALRLAYSCGLRLGEVFGLEWGDIDIEQKTISIRRQVQEHDGKWRFEPPKYDSFRVILADDTLINDLKVAREHQLRAKKYYAEHYTQLRVDDDNTITTTQGKEMNLVMTRENGSYISPRTMQHVARVIHGKNNKSGHVISSDFDFHSLRHTHATKLLEANVPMPAIQARLGHINIATTEIYTSHVTSDMTASLNDTINSMYNQM